MRYMLIPLLMLSACSCASTYYDLDQWAKPNFKQVPPAPAPEVETLTNESVVQ